MITRAAALALLCLAAAPDARRRPSTISRPTLPFACVSNSTGLGGSAARPDTLCADAPSKSNGWTGPIRAAFPATTGSAHPHDR